MAALGLSTPEGVVAHATPSGRIYRRRKATRSTRMYSLYIRQCLPNRPVWVRVGLCALPLPLARRNSVWAALIARQASQYKLRAVAEGPDAC